LRDRLKSDRLLGDTVEFGDRDAAKTLLRKIKAGT